MFPALDPQLIIWKPASSYIYFFGLWQNWSLFAPEPKKYNIHLSAVITFNSGKTTVCEFPRMEKLSVFERPWKERYRKWANENLYEEKFWPDAARFIARMHCSSNQVPVSVALVRHWSDIPPPRKPHVNASADSEQQNVFFTYKVAPGDLL